jgi:predicted permease
MLNALLSDIRYTVRTLRRAPGFTLVVVATLALAVGINTTLFSLFNAIVLRPLPVQEPQRLVVLSATDARGAQSRFIYQATFEALRSAQRSFDLLSLYSGGGVLLAEARGASVDGGVESVMPEYFEMLGIRPSIGRLITREEAAGRDGAPVVVISHRFWQRQFGGDPQAVGAAIKIENTLLTVVGVTPPEFHGLQAAGGADFFVTVPTLRPITGDSTRPLRARNVIARLRPGVTLEQARAELEAGWPAIRAAPVPGLPPRDQDEMRSQRATLESIASGFSTLRQRYADPLTVLVGLTTMLLAIGCANLSGLLLARAVARGQDVAVRRALGASRGRLIQHLLVESLLLSAAGTLVAVPLAWWASRLLSEMFVAGSTVPLARPMTPDLRVLSVAAIVAVGTGLLVGVLPAWLATHGRADAVLQPSRAIVSSVGRTGRALLVTQVALSLVLLVGAGLFAKSLLRVRANERGFPSRNLVWARLWLKPDARNATLDRVYFAELHRQLSQIPGAESVAFSTAFPSFFNFSVALDAFAPADAADASREATGMTEVVSPGFFQTVGIARQHGRDFTWDDDARAAPIAIVSASLAQKLFPNGGAVGERVRLARDPAGRAFQIVGVVNDAPIGNIRDPHVGVLFRPMLQELARARVPIGHVRTSREVNAVRAAYAGVVASLGRHFLRSVSTLDEQVDQSLLQERLVAWFSSFFAALAVLLACVGVYGLVAYAVARRTREIGVRMALGATRGSVLQMVVREALAVVLVGIGIGVPCALASGRFVRSQLYGLSPNDPATLAVAASVFIVVAIAAGLLPAYRASTIDPMVALRHE